MDKKDALRKLVRERSRTPFKWGEWDCCQFANQLYILTREDASSGQRDSTLYRGSTTVDPSIMYGRYENSAGAQEILDEHGGVEGIAREWLGAPIPKESLEIGDLIVVDLPMAGELLGAMGSTGGIVITERGLLNVPRSYIKHGWRL